MTDKQLKSLGFGEVCVLGAIFLYVISLSIMIILTLCGYGF